MQTIYWKWQDNKTEILDVAGKLLQQGEVVAFPTETVYGLGADGLNPVAAAKIFAAKGRPADNPLILHIAKQEDILPLTSGLTANAEALIKAFWPGPLTLIVAKSAIVPDIVSAGLDTVAVRMPSHPVAVALIKKAGRPIAAPSANISGKPSPTNAQAVLEDMEGKIAAIIDDGNCDIGVESTVVDTTLPIPMILRPGGITREMLREVLGEIDIDPAVMHNKEFKPRAPGMKYRHYAPKAPMYLVEGDGAVEQMPILARKALFAGCKIGVLCSQSTAEKLPEEQNCITLAWGTDIEDLAEHFYDLLRKFDQADVNVILAEAVEENGLGLAVMNRMRKAAGQQILVAKKESIALKNGTLLPNFMVE